MYFLQKLDHNQKLDQRSVAHYIQLVFIYKMVMWLYTFLSRMYLIFSIRKCVTRRNFCLHYEVPHLALKVCSKNMTKPSTFPCIMKLSLYFSHVMLFLGRTLLGDVDLDVISYNSFQVCLLWQICNSKTRIIFRRFLYIHFLLALSVYKVMRLSTFSSS